MDESIHNHPIYEQLSVECDEKVKELVDMEAEYD